MRQAKWIATICGFVAFAFLIRPAHAQPGHAPFTFAPFEIDDYERSLAPNGIVGATVVDIGVVPGYHPAAVAAGMSVGYKTGAPVYLEDSASTYEQYGGILNHVGGGSVTPTNFEDIFPGGTAVSPDSFPNGGAGRNQPNTPSSYNGTKISLVTRTDANTGDDVGITSGNQALRVSMLNVHQGDSGTSFDRPVALVIKPTDFWGVADSRFNTFETVRSNPSQYSVSIDVTFLANEIPDTFDPTSGPFIRLGFYSAHAGLFSESPTDVLQSPPSLVFGNVDDDGDGLPNFSDPDYIDPNNPVNLPGHNVPGVIQRHYVFPASAMLWPSSSLAGVTDLGNRAANGGLSDAYVMGFVFNGGWAQNTSASFIVDNFEFIPRNPLDHADFNHDGVLDAADWQILINSLNATTPKTFEQGDIGSNPDETSVSPGIVDFADFSRFEEIWDANHGTGSFNQLLAGVPEPAAILLLVIGAGAMMTRHRFRRKLHTIIPIVAAMLLLKAAPVSAALSNTLLFGFEPPPDPNLQHWTAAGDAANTTMPPVVSADASSATGATQASTRSLKITQNGSGFSWDAAVSIFGSQSGLPDQATAFNNALDTGAGNYVLEMDVTYRDAGIPPASFVNMSARLSAGSGSTDQVDNLALAGDGTGPIPDQTIPVSIPLSIAPINTGDSVLSVPDQSSKAGFYNIELGFNGDWGSGSAATFYVDNIRLRQVTQPPLLTLEVNTTTGQAKIRNTAGEDSGTGPVVFDYYEVKSANAPANGDYNNDGVVDGADYVVWRKNLGASVTLPNDATPGTVTQADYDDWRANFASTGQSPSLNPAGWNSLDAQNTDAVDGSDAGTVAGDSLLEGWDKSGSPSASALSEAFLNGSSTWDTNETLSIGDIYTPGGPQNLVFRYREPDRPGFLRTGLVTYVSSGLGSSTGVPEPSTVMIVGVALISVLGWRPRGLESGSAAS
ncbi:MAG TPA: PEP-CTERM sorting domain-containing protein [Lacipirellulaceae bacterium]|nr:PEP-CTERM sorting domain-containing protein [Lacipirellulaceae bacterium]